MILKREREGGERLAREEGDLFEVYVMYIAAFTVPTVICRFFLFLVILFFLFQKTWVTFTFSTVIHRSSIFCIEFSVTKKNSNTHSCKSLYKNSNNKQKSYSNLFEFIRMWRVNFGIKVLKMSDGDI